MPEQRRYAYVGPQEIVARVTAAGGRPVTSEADLERWLVERGDELDEPFTFVVDVGRTLLLAPRRSEHVACAGGAAVLAAGEMAFERRDGRWTVTGVSNQSTGYCPDASCWPAVAAALDRAGVSHPGGFTDVFVFRHCPACGELNVVKDDHYVCAFCEGDLPLVP
jgi:hypothetical protein